MGQTIYRPLTIWHFFSANTYMAIQLHNKESKSSLGKQVHPNRGASGEGSISSPLSAPAMTTPCYVQSSMLRRCLKCLRQYLLAETKLFAIHFKARANDKRSGPRAIQLPSSELPCGTKRQSATVRPTSPDMIDFLFGYIYINFL